MSSNEYEKKAHRFLRDNQVDAKQLIFDKSCHSVIEAAETAGVEPQDIIKSICMIDSDENVIVAIVKGEDRASTKRVAKALGIERPSTAKPNEILERTGYPCGGTPPIGFKATFLIDPRVMEKETVYAGGGSENSLIKISPAAIQTANQGKVVRVRR